MQCKLLKYKEKSKILKVKILLIPISVTLITKAELQINRNIID